MPLQLSIGCVVGVVGADLAVAGGEEVGEHEEEVEEDEGGAATEVVVVVAADCTVSSCGWYGVSRSWSRHSILKQWKKCDMLQQCTEFIPL